MELCRTGTKQSNPDLFNFDVILAGHDMVTDAGRATMCRSRSRDQPLQREIKNEGPSENIGST